MNDIVQKVLAEHQMAMEEHRIMMAKAPRHRLLALALLLFIGLVSLLDIPGAAVQASATGMSEMPSHMKYVLATSGVFIAGLFGIIAWFVALINKQARISAELIEIAFALGRSVGSDNGAR